MIKKYFFTIVLLISSLCFEQNFKNPFKINEPIVIFLQDGTVHKGIGRIGYENEVIFKENKKAKKQVFNERNVLKIVFEKLGVDLTLEYKIIKGKRTPLLLELVLKGELNLYQEVYENTEPGNYYTTTNYFFSKKNEIFVTEITSTHPFSKNFKKVASKYFKDCPLLVKKIESKEFTKKDIVKVVEFYNKNCDNKSKELENKNLKYSDKLNLRNGKSI